MEVEMEVGSEIEGEGDMDKEGRGRLTKREGEI